MTISFEEADLIGRLTGYRCKKCGCCLYFNSIGSAWCSGCEWRDSSDEPWIEMDRSQFSYVPVPKDHPHIIQFGRTILENRKIEDD